VVWRPLATDFGVLGFALAGLFLVLFGPFLTQYTLS